MSVKEEEKNLITAIRHAVRESGLDMREAVDVLLACAAGLAMKHSTHECHEFFELAHGLYHDAEAAAADRQQAVNKEPTSVH